MPQATTLNLPSADDLSRQFTEDIQLGCIESGIDVPPVGKGTHYGLTGKGAGNIGSILIANQQLIDQDSNPLTATGKALEDIRISDGLKQKPPVRARLQLQASVQGAATIPSGLSWQGPGGVRGKIDTLKTGVSGNLTVTSIVDDAGSAGNLKVGTFVNFVNPPLNVQTQAVVTAILSLGADIESDEDKRARIMLARQNPPAGGNWSHLNLEALSTTTNADGVWVYCALGGPGSTKVILTRTNPTTPNDRTVDKAGIDAVINAYALAFPKESQNIVVDTAVNDPRFVGLKTTLSTSSGAFWVDGASAWPEWPAVLSLISGSIYRLTGVGTDYSSQLSAGQKRTVGAWNPSTLSFAQVTISAISGTYPGPYTVAVSGTTDDLSGMYVSPWAPNINLYAQAMLAEMLKMGPGEYVAASSPRYYRARRRPDPSTSGPYKLNAVQTAAVQAKFPTEILQMLIFGDVLTPTLPSNKADKPRIITPSAIAFYPGDQ